MSAKRSLRGLNEIEWASFTHPYGAAIDVPDHLRGLLAGPDTDEAAEAGVFFLTYFVCQGSHFGDAVVPTIPFLVRLATTPGVSRRGAILASLLSMVRISLDEAFGDVEPALKQRCLDTFRRRRPRSQKQRSYFAARSSRTRSTSSLSHSPTPASRRGTT